MHCLRLQRLDALYAIGGGPGANRIGYTSGGGRGARARAPAGCARRGSRWTSTRTGTWSAVCAATSPELPEVWTGSHLDSVPQGGRYDGALGVVAGIEALERLGRQRRTLAVVAFRDEERGCAGSRALLRGRHAARCVPRAPPRAGAPARPRRGAARRRHRDRRLQARREDVRRPRRSRGHDADGGARGRARRGGRRDPPDPRRRALDRGRSGDRRPARGRAGRQRT